MYPGITHRPFEDIMKNRRMYGLPKIESVARVRRRIQEHRPDLRAPKDITEGRYDNWKEARDYAFKED